MNKAQVDAMTDEDIIKLCTDLNSIYDGLADELQSRGGASLYSLFFNSNIPSQYDLLIAMGAVGDLVGNEDDGPEPGDDLELALEIARDALAKENAVEEFKATAEKIRAYAVRVGDGRFVEDLRVHRDTFISVADGVLDVMRGKLTGRYFAALAAMKFEILLEFCRFENAAAEISPVKAVRYYFEIAQEPAVGGNARKDAPSFFAMIGDAPNIGWAVPFFRDFLEGFDNDLRELRDRFPPDTPDLRLPHADHDPILGELLSQANHALDALHRSGPINLYAVMDGLRTWKTLAEMEEISMAEANDLLRVAEDAEESIYTRARAAYDLSRRFGLEMEMAVLSEFTFKKGMSPCLKNPAIVQSMVSSVVFKVKASLAEGEA